MRFVRFFALKLVSFWNGNYFTLCEHTVNILKSLPTSTARMLSGIESIEVDNKSSILVCTIYFHNELFFSNESKQKLL